MTNKPCSRFAGCRTWLLAGLLIVMTAGCDTPRGSGSIDGIELGLKLQLHLDHLARQDTGLDPDRLAPVRALFNQPPQGLDSLRLYTARAEVDDEGTMDLRLALMPLQGVMAGGYLAVVVGDDGVVYRTRLWGTPAFDTDPESAWENFWRQFQYRKTRAVIDPSSALSDTAVDQFWMRLQADSSQAPDLRALYRHTRMMLDNSFLIRRTMALTANDAVPDPSWYQRYVDNFDQLDAIAAALQPVIGDEAVSKYQADTRQARALLEPLVSHARASDANKARTAIMDFRRRTCGTCHAIEEHTLGEGGIRDALLAEFKTLGVRRDLYRVGYDVWPAPGAETASQEIASAIKAILLVLGMP